MIMFVYGTLKKGYYNYEKFLKGKCSKISNGYTKGILYNIKGEVFPAMLYGDKKVYGEIYEIKDESVIKEVDALEMFHNLDTDMYKRETHKIVTDEGKEIFAQVYVYQNNDLSKLTEIDSGNFTM